ncbi:3-hydroxyisobutyrate dehydrogenase, mitochondrial isoform X1 [Nycticebus coucang]|uniref:3-hydroxyisobutyrate dehydrogenase, mitochondrial isoform X1 n=2 Tax=Nycticebus coucang TaxID=9470 RepID=UPI00234C46E5|nr:3-hydroxyisobutyrate dehydrogenase, mitochondrial isoform X1 [Nycticebus coucang]
MGRVLPGRASQRFAPPLAGECPTPQAARARARAVPRCGPARWLRCAYSQSVGPQGGGAGCRREAGQRQSGGSMASSLWFRGATFGRRYWSRRLQPAATAVCSRSMASKTPVGFIGLGNMGNPMAKNLMKHGYPLIIYDVFPDACKEFQDSGEQVVSSPADVAERADRIITMLPTSINAVEAYTGANGILKKVKKGSLLIDSSTIDPAVSKELAKEVEKMGAVFMDAPVSGGVGAAQSGNLTFMVGGVEDEFAAAQELLGCMGSNVVYCGAVGTGQAAKICNNMLLAISMIGTAEAMNLGIRLGLDPKLLAKILNMSSGRCWSSDTYNPVPGVMDGVPSANNYQGGFGTTLMAKDLGLAQDSATSTKSPILLGSLAHQIYRMMCAKGYSKKDFSSVFQFLREEETF